MDVVKDKIPSLSTPTPSQPAVASIPAPRIEEIKDDQVNV